MIEVSILLLSSLTNHQRSCIRVKEVSILLLSTFYPMDFRIVSSVWYVRIVPSVWYVRIYFVSMVC